MCDQERETKNLQVLLLQEVQQSSEMRKLKLIQTTLIIALTLTLSPLLAQIECEKCDIEKVKTVNENIGDLTFKIVEEFLCTFDDSCGANIEFSQWSNEMFYKLLDIDPNLVFRVLESGQADNMEILLDEIENPIHEFNFENIYAKISNVETTLEFKEKLMKSIELAADKEGLKIEK